MTDEELKKFSIGLEFKRGIIELPMLELKQIQKENFISSVSGCSVAFSKDKLLKLGGYDELFNPFYWEEVDLSYRAWKRGWKILFEPESLVYHQTHSTISDVCSKQYITKISERNRYILVWKNISDKKMLFYHFAWVPFRLLKAFVKCEWWKLPSFFLALGKLKGIRQNRSFVSSS